MFALHGNQGRALIYQYRSWRDQQRGCCLVLCLSCLQHLEFKTLSLMSMQVEAVPQALVRSYVTMRHNALLDRHAELEAELAELRALVRRTPPRS